MPIRALGTKEADREYGAIIRNNRPYIKQHIISVTKFTKGKHILVEFVISMILNLKQEDFKTWEHSGYFFQSISIIFKPVVAREMNKFLVSHHFSCFLCTCEDS